MLRRLEHAMHGGPDVAELVLEITPDVMVGKVWCDWWRGLLLQEDQDWEAGVARWWGGRAWQ